MNTLELLKQMAILFAMMVSGMIAYRCRWIDDRTSRRLSALVVNLFNPFLILTSVSGEIPDDIRRLTGQNLLLSVLFFAFLAVCAAIYVTIRRFPLKENRSQQLMILLPNVGFMGVPVVRGVLGDEYVILVVFYMLVYNIIAYTYGIMLALGMSDTKKKFSIRMIFNTGFIFTVIAVVIFFSGISMPAPAAVFCDYMGNCTIPLSMILIGVSLAQMTKQDIFSKENFRFVLVRMIIIPVAGILLFRLLPFDQDVIMVFNIMICMPVGSLTGMLAETYGHCGAPVNRMVAISTILSVATIPLISLLY